MLGVDGVADGAGPLAAITSGAWLTRAVAIAAANSQPARVQRECRLPSADRVPVARPITDLVQPSTSKKRSAGH
jgi:hypothetical protein